MLRDKRGFDITRDLNKQTVAEPGLEAETSLGQTTVRLDIEALDLATAIDGAADFIPIYDQSLGVHKKILPNSLPDATLVVQGCISEIFYASGTYVKPSGATAVYVQLIGGGGGGGGGSAGTDTAGGAGAGGGGGAVTWGWLAGSDIGSSVPVTVGQGGLGGNGGLHQANGLPGMAGGDSMFGSHIRAQGGGGGGAGVQGFYGQIQGGTGGIGLFNAGAGGSTDIDQQSDAGGDTEVSGGGGGGGAPFEGLTLRLAGRGGYVFGYPHGDLTFMDPSKGAAGTNTTTTGATAGAGGNGASAPSGMALPGAGGGGGGAASGVSTQGGLGGDGGTYGGGGGGGGACRGSIGTSRGGRGGDGGRGIVVVTTFL